MRVGDRVRITCEGVVDTVNEYATEVFLDGSNAETAFYTDEMAEDTFAVEILNGTIAVGDKVRVIDGHCASNANGDVIAIHGDKAWLTISGTDYIIGIASLERVMS